MFVNPCFSYKHVIERAKKYATSRGTSVSRLVESYLSAVTKPDDSDRSEITPFVKSLSSGSKIPAELDYKSEFHGHQVDKHA